MTTSAVTPPPSEEAVRLEHLNALKRAGINPYPALAERSHMLQAAKALPAGAKVRVAGRLVAKREMGKLCFGHLKDATDKLQIALSAQELGKE